MFNFKKLSHFHNNDNTNLFHNVRTLSKAQIKFPLVGVLAKVTEMPYEKTTSIRL
jgi:hypothetical protein